MFFDIDLLTRSGPFATSWLIAILPDHKALTRRRIVRINIVRLGEKLMEYIATNSGLGSRRMSLYLSAQLIYGTTLIYYRQLNYFQDDCFFYFREIMTAKQKNLEPKRLKKKSNKKSPLRALPAPPAEEIPEALEIIEVPEENQILNDPNKFTLREEELLGPDVLRAIDYYGSIMEEPSDIIQEINFPSNVIAVPDPNAPVSITTNQLPDDLSKIEELPVSSLVSPTHGLQISENSNLEQYAESTPIIRPGVRHNVLVIETENEIQLDDLSITRPKRKGRKRKRLAFDKETEISGAEMRAQIKTAQDMDLKPEKIKVPNLSVEELFKKSAHPMGRTLAACMVWNVNPGTHSDKTISTSLIRKENRPENLMESVMQISEDPQHNGTVSSLQTRSRRNESVVIENLTISQTGSKRHIPLELVTEAPLEEMIQEPSVATVDKSLSSDTASQKQKEEIWEKLMNLWLIEGEDILFSSLCPVTTMKRKDAAFIFCYLIELAHKKKIQLITGNNGQIGRIKKSA